MAEALGLGALLGLVAYGTYDFTNLSTLRNWPLRAVADRCLLGHLPHERDGGGGYAATNWLAPN